MTGPYRTLSIPDVRELELRPFNIEDDCPFCGNDGTLIRRQPRLCTGGFFCRTRTPHLHVRCPTLFNGCGAKWKTWTKERGG